MLAHVTVKDDKKLRRRIFERKIMKKLDSKLTFKLKSLVVIFNNFIL